MRIISQNGAIDVPYEMSAIRNDDKLIILCMAGETGKGSVIATYSTSEKAQKAMEMLRNSYCGLPIIMKNVDISDEVIELLKDLKKNGIIFQKVEENPSVEYVDNTYFKFPKDEEIEV